MGESLNLSPLRRAAEVLRPDWSRTLAARRIAAGGLVALAAVAALRPDPGDDRAEVVVAAHDLAPGVKLGETDVRLETHTAAMVPDGAYTDLAAVVGATLTGPARRGETLTDVRLLSPRLAEAAVGPGARVVPLHLEQAAVLDLIRAGDVVDVIAAGADGATATVVATDAVVVLVSQKPAGNGAERVVLVALPAHAAPEVAAASLGHALTLTLH